MSSVPVLFFFFPLVLLTSSSFYSFDWLIKFLDWSTSSSPKNKTEVSCLCCTFPCCMYRQVCWTWTWLTGLVRPWHPGLLLGTRLVLVLVLVFWYVKQQHASRGLWHILHTGTRRELLFVIIWLSFVYKERERDVYSFYRCRGDMGHFLLYLQAHVGEYESYS